MHDREQPTHGAVAAEPECSYGTREQVRQRGYDTRELDALREANERYLRGDLDRAAAQAVVDRAAVEPWFELAWVP